MIPEFDENGNLPPGEHACGWEEFSERFGSNSHRGALLEGMKRALLNLKGAGCTRAWIDGSFVSDKEFPADYDGMWAPEGISQDTIDSVFMNSDDMRYGARLQKAIYLGELFPYHKLHVDNFAEDRQGNKKGIVVLNLKEIQP